MKNRIYIHKTYWTPLKNDKPKFEYQIRNMMYYGIRMAWYENGSRRFIDTLKIDQRHGLLIMFKYK